ncbi:MAG TPA: hypothetical protein VMT52_09265, partial [Planctomycetota bacterium]|nr:hypothetical protein [Planctomycetota bacterium]
MRDTMLAGGVGAIVCLAGIFFPGTPLQAAQYIRGDADASGELEITDGIRVLGYLFLGNPESLDCEDASDADGSGTINISDAIYVLQYLFSGGPAPPAPFPGCGADPTEDGLGCEAYPACEDPPDPFAVIVNLDESRAVTRTIPAEGGTLEATGADGTVYTLAIPSGALLSETEITMTPIASLEGLDATGGEALGIDLKPGGLRFYDFAALTIRPLNLGAPADVLGFHYEGKGEEF